MSHGGALTRDRDTAVRPGRNACHHFPRCGSARLRCHRRRFRPWDAASAGPVPHPTDVWSVEEPFDDLFGDLAADLFGRLLRDLLDEFPEDVVHTLHPF